MISKKILVACLPLVLLASCSKVSDAQDISVNTDVKQTTTVPEVTDVQMTSSGIFSDDSTDHNQNPEFSVSTEINAEMFTEALSEVDVTVSDENIYEQRTVNGQNYSLTIDLTKWGHYTSSEQIKTLSQLFWQCYPRMYERFHDLSDPPTNVIIAIENEGYEIAEAYDNHIHLHDMWLYDNPEDYDCITHELAHIIQAGWDDAYLEYSDYIERFADCCRYEYAMNDGVYNDVNWELQSVSTESDRSSSVRFLVWLDYMYSDAHTDIMRNYFHVCRNMMYSYDQWDEAWREIFKGTELSGKNIDEVWEMYAGSDFAYCSSAGYYGGNSELLEKYPVRQKLKSLDR